MSKHFTDRSLTIYYFVGDNAFPAIWSFLEICVATICACLPAIRVLLSRWFPSIFDITSTSSTSSHHHKKLNSSDHGIHPTYPRHPAEKIGPTYNKRVIFTPDDELLSTTPESGEFMDNSVLERGERELETKVWINPRFDGEGNVIESQGPVIERHDSQPSSETSLWALEGPMVGDVDAGGSGKGKAGEKARDVEMGNIGMAVSKGSATAKAEYKSPRLQRIWASKSLPPLPTGGRSGQGV